MRFGAIAHSFNHALEDHRGMQYLFWLVKHDALSSRYLIMNVSAPVKLRIRISMGITTDGSAQR